MQLRSIWRLARLLLIAAPPLLIALLVFRDGVDIPYWDEWDGTAPLFEKMATGTLGFADFFAQHNEHRILFPRLIFFGLGRLTHWNVRAELFVVWFLTLVCLFNIWQITWRSSRKEPSFWLLFSSSVLLFSPLSFENFLWGFQIGFLLPLACVTGCIWVATYVRHPFNFVFSILLSTVCMFSIASGFTTWLLATPLLLLAQAPSNSDSRKKWWAIWICTFFLELIVCFYGYKKPAHHPPLSWSSQHPALAGQYFLVFLGSPFTYGTNLPPLAIGTVMGGLLVLILLTCAVYLWSKRRDRDLLSHALPWLMLAMIAASAALLTMIGRGGFGWIQARSSRYIAFAVMLPIALLALVPVVRFHWIRSWSARDQRLAKVLSSLPLAPFILLAFPSFLADLPLWPFIREGRLYRKALVSFIDVVPEPEALGALLFPHVDRIKIAANTLSPIGYLRPALLQSNLVRDVADPASGGSPRFGQFQLNRNKWNQIQLTGQALLPDKGGPADAVLITYDNAEGEPVICAITSIDAPQQGRLRFAWDSSALPSKWNLVLPRARLPKNEQCLLKAWSYDAELCRAFRLQGSATVGR
jgi:hypothetical protein